MSKIFVNNLILCFVYGFTFLYKKRHVCGMVCVQRYWTPCTLPPKNVTCRLYFCVHLFNFYIYSFCIIMSVRFTFWLVWFIYIDIFGWCLFKLQRWLSFAFAVINNIYLDCWIKIVIDFVKMYFWPVRPHNITNVK